MRRRLLLTGGSGLLGSNIATTACRDFDVYATYNSRVSKIPETQFVRLDIRDRQHVVALFNEIKPDLVIHAAALVNLDRCEEKPDEAWATNVDGTENVAVASAEVGARLILISTNAVFDGLKGMYCETDAPNPLNAYARTKLEAEKRALQWVPSSIVVRSAFFGWSLHPGTSLAEWIVGDLRAGKTIDGFSDVFFSPILVNNLAEVLLEMYWRELAGVFHVGSIERCSKYDFGLQIAQAFDLDRELMRPTSVDESGLTAARPKDLSLNVGKISGSIGTRLPGVGEGIAQFRDLELSSHGVHQ